MLKRHLTKELETLAKEYPVVTVLGPRQAGKTTLCRFAFSYAAYCSLESPEVRSFAENDPKMFLKQFSGPVILDEIQRVPELLSYIQLIVDEKKNNGQFILTGSHQLKLRESITQSLAGRTAILELLPFSMNELADAGIRFSDFSEYVHHGFLPRIYDQKQRPFQAYSNYYQTYVERDVRQLIHLKDATLFEKFMKILAGRVGQLIDYQSLGNDVGVDAKTIRNWLSILEASYIIYRLPPYFENFGKRLIKSPKYYFVDVGLLAYLLGIETPEQVVRDPLVGAIFENLIVIEILKSRLNRGLPANLYFYRENKGYEVDLLFQKGREWMAVEIKSSSTFGPSLVSNLKKAPTHIENLSQLYLVYSGGSQALSTDLAAVHFAECGTIAG